jgi:NADH dehydrogenase (ubiquinone) Fe-S protein 1
MLELQFKLNDFQYFANSKMTIMQACLTNKIDVPRFCFHEQLSIAGNCRMCLVEDSKQFKPIASCAVDTSDSLGIYTNTAKVKKARESVLEFLLANHPLDCPICDQGGECDLQDQSIVFGSDRGRFYEFKRSVEDKNCGPLIKTIMNRCIHCTRRIRFGNEIAGVNLLGNTGRGSRMEIGSYTERLMKTELSGNVIDLCPVGALTSKPFSFTSRPWELKNYDSIDLLDSLHSNIRVDVRGTKIMRILPRVNNDVNGDWITDKIRFSYDSFHRQRLYGPMLKLKSSLVKVTWRKAFIFLKSHFLNILEAGLNRSLPLRLYPGNFIDFETTYMIRRFTSFTGSVSTVSGPVDNRFLYGFNTPISQIISADLCLLIVVNLRLSLPLVNSKIRQLSLKGNIPVYVIGSYSSFNYYTKHISSVSETILDICEGLH